MVLAKKLATGTCVRTVNFDEEECGGIADNKGQAVGVKDSRTGGYRDVMIIESRKCAEGTVNRIELKKSVLEDLGFTVIIC